MGRINYQGLIDEVLNMVKKKREEDRAQANSIRWDDTEAGQSYWKDMRSRNTELSKQSMVNAGNMSVEKERTAGELARQQMGNVGNENVATIQSGAHVAGAELQSGAARYTADQALLGEKYKAGQAGKTKADLAGLTAILEDSYATPEEKVRARRMIFNSYGGGNMNPQTGAGGQFDSNVPVVKPSPAAPIPLKTQTNKTDPNSFMAIDSQITDELNKKKYTGNKYLDWGIKRMRNITAAPGRVVGAGLFGADNLRRSISEWEGWNK